MPVHDEQEAASSREHPLVGGANFVGPDLPSLAGMRVLVVEDDADARDLLRALLESHHASVVLAASGGEGLALLRSQRPDVVMSDIGMPGMDGYEFIRRVRRLPVQEGGAIPAIALTAFARTEDRTRALLDGYQLHLAKPVVATELVVALASLRSGLERTRRMWSGRDRETETE